MEVDTQLHVTTRGLGTFKPNRHRNEDGIDGQNQLQASKDCHLALKATKINQSIMTIVAHNSITQNTSVKFTDLDACSIDQSVQCNTSTNAMQFKYLLAYKGRY